LADDLGCFGSLAKFKNSIDMVTGLMDIFCVTVVSIATASGSNIELEMASLSAGSGVVARR